MNEKVGRNDPCPCGSGKKYKQCCFLKSTQGKPLKLRAKILTQPKVPQGPNLMERAFGDASRSLHNEPPPKPFHVTKEPPE